MTGWSYNRGSHIMPGEDPGFLRRGHGNGELSRRVLRLNMNV